MTTSLLKEKYKVAVRYILTSFGIGLRKHRKDRVVLEDIIFPYFVSNPKFNSILFVGCQWYTKSYSKIFKHKDYQTIEIDPKARKYGAKKHITDSMENILEYYKESELDLIICNGVWGWGLNNKSQAEKAFLGCYKCLRKGGIFILGWNNLSEYIPYPLAESESLKLFQPFIFTPLSASQYQTATQYRHTYNFYIKS